MSDNSYQEVLSRVQHLSQDDQLRLLEDLAALIRRQVTVHPRRSILELEGLGAEIWQGVDAQAYVDRERDSWSG